LAAGAGVALAVFTPPCRAHAPRPALLLVPSPQVTVAAAGFGAAPTVAAAGAAGALLAAFRSAFAAAALFFVAILSRPP